MAMENCTELYRFEEWTIENFSCWNREIHGNVITTGKYFIAPDFSVALYPRGNSGCDEDLVVCLGCSNSIVFSGDVSFIGPDGSVLYTQQVDSIEMIYEITLPPGPKFEEVISEIKRNQDLHGDRLILRYRIRRHVDSKVYRKTTIDIFNATFRIIPEILDGLVSTSEMISSLTYPFDEDEIGDLNLCISKGKTGSTRILLTLKPVPFKSKVLVHTRMFVLRNEEVVRTEENEHLFQDGESWTFAKSLAIEEVRGKGVSFILQLKIVPCSTPKKCLSVFHYHKEAVSLLSSDKSSSVGTSSAAKNHFSKTESSLSLQNLSEELMCLQQDQNFSDCRLKCGNVTFSVHKNILSARSPVFKTMLTTDMREAASGEMDIIDLDPSTLARFLTFLYTGAVGEEERLQVESTLNLYYAADKYQVSSLKRVCKDLLCANVSFTNVCDILSLADKHQDDQMIVVAQNFILDNYNDVLRSEEWKTFMSKESLLAVKTLTFFADKKNIGRRDAF